MLQTPDIGASFDCQIPLAKLEEALNGKAKPDAGLLSEDDVLKIQKAASKKDPVFRLTFD